LKEKNASEKKKNNGDIFMSEMQFPVLNYLVKESFDRNNVTLRQSAGKHSSER
jgi:hypothetical protein